MQVSLSFALLGCACLSNAFRVRQKAGARTRRTGSVRVGTLGGHGPGSWSGACGQASDKGLERAQCNLNVYEEAAKAAQSSGIDLLVLPEYGLINGGRSAHTDVPPSVGDQPCGLEGSSHAQVSGLSCIARQYSVALAANTQTNRNGGKYITEIVYDKNGTVVAVYDKNKLFLGEGGLFGWAQAGPFQPTVFELFGQKWGIAICFEGQSPVRDWSQFNGLRDEGAQNLIWSIGNFVFGNILTSSAAQIVNEVHLNVFASMNFPMGGGDVSTALIGADGSGFAVETVNLDQGALTALNYTVSPFIHYTDV